MGLHRVRHNWSDLACMHAYSNTLTSSSKFTSTVIQLNRKECWGQSMSGYGSSSANNMQPWLVVSLPEFLHLLLRIYVRVQSLSLWDPMDCGLSFVHKIFQAKILEWVVISSSKGPSQPRDGTHILCVSCIRRRILYHWATWNVH